MTDQIGRKIGDQLSLRIDGHNQHNIHCISAVNLPAQAVKFTFLNPDKETYPDIVRSYEIKGMYKVCSISRWTEAAKRGCHCATEGEYCGEGCINEKGGPKS